MDSDPPALEKLARIHPGIWIENFARILTKTRDLVRPKLNVFQARAVAAYSWCIANEVPPRLIGLKPRQVGGTTIFAALNYHHGRRFNCKSISIADVFDKSNNLFQMLCTFAQYDELDWGFGHYEPTKTSLILKNGTEFLKRSADTPTAGRGDTIQSLHCSEESYWKDTPVKSAKDVLVSLLGGLAKHNETFGGKESTPNGITGAFADDWVEARWPDFDPYWMAYSTQPDGPGSGWIRIYASWFEFPEHRESVRTGRPIIDDQVKMVMDTLTDEEEAGINAYQWDADQILWRRWALANECLNDLDRFNEEYPSDPETCFLSSGRPRFDTKGVSVLMHRSRSIDPERGLIVEQNGNVAWQHTGPNEAMFFIWEHPKIGCRYLISVDTMTGLLDAIRSKETDCHSPLVWRAGYKDHEGTWNDPRLVARIVPPCILDNEPLAKLIDLLSRYYGHCIVAPEVNQGSGLVKELRDLDVPIFRMAAYDKVQQKTVTTLGWQTNEDRRRDIVDNLANRIREQSVDIACRHMVSELSTFIRNGNRSEAASGKKDDDVLSGAIGLFTVKDSATELVEKIVERRLPSDYHAWKVQR